MVFDGTHLFQRHLQVASKHTTSQHAPFKETFYSLENINWY